MGEDSNGAGRVSTRGFIRLWGGVLIVLLGFWRGSAMEGPGLYGQGFGGSMDM